MRIRPQSNFDEAKNVAKEDDSSQACKDYSFFTPLSANDSTKNATEEDDSTQICKNFSFVTPVSLFEEESLVSDLPRFLPINADRPFFDQIIEDCQLKRPIKYSKINKPLLMPRASFSNRDSSYERNAIDETKISDDLFLPDLQRNENILRH